jgi:four helix bundle protein
MTRRTASYGRGFEFWVLSFGFPLSTLGAWPASSDLKTSKRGGMRASFGVPFTLLLGLNPSPPILPSWIKSGAAISPGSNIAEGFERDGNRELIQFLSVAKGSIGEIKDQLYCALDERYITRLQFDQIYRMAETTSRLVGGFMSYLRKSEVTGHKFDTGSTPANRKLKTQNSKPIRHAVP